jgi:hypothetical protein
MMASVDWQRVARHVRARRMKLGLKQRNTPDVSAATWSKIENGAQESYKPFVVANIERTLGWPSGTISDIGAGGSPPDDEGPTLGERVATLEQRFTQIEQTLARLLRRLGA